MPSNATPLEPPDGDGNVTRTGVSRLGPRVVERASGLDRREEEMFRCDNCGSGYSAQAASSWISCPRCLAKEKIQVPLAFELGWQRRDPGAEAGQAQPQRADSQPALR